MHTIRRLLLLVLFAGLPMAMRAQGPSAPERTQNAAVRAFLDCDVSGCDRDFFVTEMKWVNWMRDRLDAELHVLITSIATGSNGRQYTVAVIGQKQFAGRVDSLVVVSQPNDANDTQRRALMRAMSQLLLPYAARTPLGERLSVNFASPSGGDTPANAAAKDKWNFWTFSISANGFGNGEKRQSFTNFYNNIDANRTTEEWKARFGLNFSYDQSEFELSDGTRFMNLQRNYGGNAMLVKSLDKHWSAGARAMASYSDYYNTDLNASAQGAVEWDYYPYSQFARRKFTVLYSAGLQSFRYRETTIYDKDKETHPVHSMNVGFSARQPWGSANVSINGSQFLDNMKYNNIGVSGGVDVRMGKGFSFNIGGSANRVRDQLYLPRGDASNEEIIARQQALATGYRYFTYFGLRYQFGSMFNSIVNPRFGSFGGGGGGMMITMD